MRVWSRRDVLAFTLTFLVALGGYVYSLPDSITLEDAGELAVAADTLGVPHPPGYPIWTFLAWIFQKVLFWTEYRGYPDPARAVACMSATFGALACGFTAMLISRFTRELLGNGLLKDPLSLRRNGISRVAGAALGLIACLVWQRFPTGGQFLFTLITLGLVGVGLLQALTPQDRRYAFQDALPSVAQLGASLMGFGLGALAWLGAWGWLRLPSLPKVFGLALAGLLVLTLLIAGVDVLLGLAARRKHLERDFLGAGVDVLAGIGGGVMLAFTPLMWSQSVIVEVYSLNAFFLSSLLVLMYSYQHRPRGKILLWTAFVFGLGLTNHQSLLFMFFFLVAAVAAGGDRALLKDGLFLAGIGALGLLIAKAVQYHRIEDGGAVAYFVQRAVLTVLFLGLLTATRGGLMRKWETLLLLLFSGALGLSFLVYMPLASSQDPPMDWGNTETWDGFVESVTRGQYARFTVTDNLRKINSTMRTPLDPAVLEPGRETALAATVARRTVFLHMLGAYFHNPEWKYSIASQFSWSFPQGGWDPAGTEPPPRETFFPLALLGLLPLLALARMTPHPRHWIACTLVAMFFVTVVFLTIQWPDLSHNDLWVKRVQYIQSHVLFAFWMATGGVLTVMALYAILPFRAVPAVGSLMVFGVFVVFPLHKEKVDSRHIAFLGASNLHDYDFGWQYGAHVLKGANGILIDELAHHKDPDALWNDWARSYLKLQQVSPDVIADLDSQAPDSPLPYSRFRKQILIDLKLDAATQRSVREAVTLAAFRALSPEEQSQQLVFLHRPLPDWDYPPELEPNAVFLGGTDPGRFVPTYMVYSAKLRPDLMVITQNALVQMSYLTTLREQYGERLRLPTDSEHADAFMDYANRLRLFDTERFTRFRTGSDRLAVSGFYEVMKINEILTRQLFDQNQQEHVFYLEESVPLKWMIPHQRPLGLIFRVEPEPVVLGQEELRKNREFWDWMEEWLLETSLPPEQRTYRFHRELQVRKSYSKLRLAQAQNFFERGLATEAELAVRQALRLYPAGPETVQVAADMLMRLRKFEDAAMVLADYSRHDPTNKFIPRFTRLLQLLRQKDQDRQRLEEELSYQITGNTALQLVYLYSDLSMPRRMEDMADLLLTLPNLSPGFYRELASFMRAMENTEYYEKALLRWTRADPTDPRPHVDLAVLALTRDDTNHMMDHLIQAIRIDGDQARKNIASDIRFLELRSDPRFLNLLQR